MEIDGVVHVDKIPTVESSGPSRLVLLFKKQDYGDHSANDA